MNVKSEVVDAIDAIERATLMLGKADSGVDEGQIARLRSAIDELELVLNAKMREFETV